MLIDLLELCPNQSKYCESVVYFFQNLTETVEISPAELAAHQELSPHHPQLRSVAAIELPALLQEVVLYPKFHDARNRRPEYHRKYERLRVVHLIENLVPTGVEWLLKDFQQQAQQSSSKLARSR